MAKSSGGVQQLVLEALERAVADPAARKLHGTKANPGIFLSGSAPAKAAARQCLEQGLLKQVGQQGTGAKATPLYSITPAGIALVLDQSPLPRLLEAMLDASERTARSVAECCRTLEVVAQQTDQLRRRFEEVSGRIQPPDLATILKQLSPGGNGAATTPGPDNHRQSTLDDALVRFVRQSKTETPLRPIDLCNLFRQAVTQVPTLSIGQFHDALRRLAGQNRLRLLPYTQAMYQLAEPQYALVVGREVMYYAEPDSDSR